MTRSHDGDGRQLTGDDSPPTDELPVQSRVGRHAKAENPQEPEQPDRSEPSETPASSETPTSSETSASSEQAGRSAGKRKPQKKGSFWKELPILIVIALVLTFLIQTFIARVYVIPSGSMEQTLHGCPGCTGDRILVDKVTYRFTDPSPGDVAVFKAPDGWEDTEFQVDPSSNVFVNWVRQFGFALGIGSPPEYDLVKRVIAVGGQTVSCCDTQNRVLVDGKPINEPYIYWEPGTPHRQDDFKPVTVPQGFLWMMGDNRNNSADSRYQSHNGADPQRGFVPVDNVIGKARIIIWPPSRWEGVRNEDLHTVAMPAPGEHQQLPLGVGFAAALPVYWSGRKVRGAVLRGSRRSKRR